MQLACNIAGCLAIISFVRRAAATTNRGVIGAVAIGAAALGTLAGLSLHHHEAAPATGYATGIAAPCIGIGDRPITVYATQDGRIVASRQVQDVKGGGHYLLQLPASTYLISTPGSDLPPRSIIVSPGRTVTVNFPDTCK